MPPLSRNIRSGIEQRSTLRNVWILTAVIVFFGFVNGLMINVTPQDALALGFSSDEIGKIGFGIPVGYAASCLLLWRLSGRLRGKFVLLCGVLGALGAMVLMALARTVDDFTTAQVIFGLVSGAFWPFASAWLLEFQSDSLGKPRLLRHYNVGWTAGAFHRLVPRGRAVPAWSDPGDALRRRGHIGRSFCGGVLREKRRGD